jgi:hypothetical protein
MITATLPINFHPHSLACHTVHSSATDGNHQPASCGTGRHPCSYYEWLGKNTRLPLLIETRIDGRPTELNVQFTPVSGRFLSRLHIWGNAATGRKFDFTVNEADFRHVCARFNELALDESSRWNDPTSYCPGKRKNSWKLHAPIFWRRQGKNTCILADVIFQVAKELAQECSCLPRSCLPAEIGGVSIFEVAGEMVRVSKFLSDSDIPVERLSCKKIYQVAVQARRHMGRENARLIRAIYAS